MLRFNMRVRDIDIDSCVDILERRGLIEGGRVQQALDNQVLTDCAPRVPRLTGVLEESGQLNTVVGSGLVVFKTPYAKKQYYENNGNGLDPMRGRLWFERAKADHLMNWAELVANESGGKVSLL